MSNVIKKQRVTVKFKRPNPLFEKWLDEWRIEYESKGSKMQYCFLKALKSLKKYPLPLQTGKDCAILEGFGTKLCVMLDKKLSEHKNSISQVQSEDPINKNAYPSFKVLETNENAASIFSKTDILQNFTESIIKSPQKGKNIKKSQKQYTPAPRSGPYALLLALYKIHQTRNVQESTKQNIIRIAQNFCDTSFTKTNSSSHYTAWSSIKTLMSKGLVIKHVNPIFFTLTDLGIKLAQQLYENNSDVSFITSNYSSINHNDVPVTNENILNSNLTKSNRSENCNFNNVNISKHIYNDSQRVNFDSCSKNSVVSYDMKSKINEKENYVEYNTENKQYNILNDFGGHFASDIENSNTIVFKPNSFNIILLVDVQETAGKKKQLDDVTLNELTRTGLTFEVRHLSVGDFTWIAQDCKNQELVLPYIIERKRMDDFGSSIKDGRFHEQKFRLKQSGIQNLIYLVENYGNNQHTGLPLSTLYQAATNTLVQDRFSVKYTSSLKQSIAYVATMTKILCDLYQKKTLIGCTERNTLPSVCVSDCMSLFTFSEFNKSAAKTKNFKVRDLFSRHLIQLKGISRDMALAIVNKYPTPKSLVDAYKGNSVSSSEKLLTTIKYGPLQRYIGPVISKTIFSLYSKRNFSEN